ncbi:MAG TPA: hypothetical protein VFJ73_00465 [Bacillales bacterium]|nr:hypothetical protein [Bacillales bacterium]
MLTYDYNVNRLDIREKKRDEDVEFNLAIEDLAMIERLKAVRERFENNDVFTDVMIYPHKDHVYQIIVREDYYIDFILELFKQKVLKSVSWTEE